MSATLLHHGHIRILKKASELGSVIVALTTDEEIFLKKGYWPELRFEERREILESITYVDTVIPSKWLIDDDFVKFHEATLLVHGLDNANQVSQINVVTFPRTDGISSSELRRRSYSIYKALNE